MMQSQQLSFGGFHRHAFKNKDFLNFVNKLQTYTSFLCCFHILDSTQLIFLWIEQKLQNKDFWTFDKTGQQKNAFFVVCCHTPKKKKDYSTFEKTRQKKEGLLEPSFKKKDF